MAKNTIQFEYFIHVLLPMSISLHIGRWPGSDTADFQFIVPFYNTHSLLPFTFSQVNKYSCITFTIHHKLHIVTIIAKQFLKLSVFDHPDKSLASNKS